jgi:hypothetical protein
MQAVKYSQGGMRVALRQKLLSVRGGRGEWQYADPSRVVTKKGGAGRLYPRATIDALPDNVLLETFDFYLGEDDVDKIKHDHNYDGWQTLVHVCRRWRCIIFASPGRLDLKLYCTGNRLVNPKMLNIWPALPIVIVIESIDPKYVTDIIAALRQHNRVRKIYYNDYKNCDIQDSPLNGIAEIDEPFPALTSLALYSSGQNVPVLPDSFLGGSAPRLRSLFLSGIPYPSMGKLLSSTTDLVRLSLCHIPRSGYIAPETIVPCLSMLPRLKSLELGFRYPRSSAHRADRHPPPLTRLVFPNLTSLDFSGDIEYLEDVLSQIETPVLNKCYFCFFNQLVFDTPLLGHFICRTETFMTIHRARVEFFSLTVGITLSGREMMATNDREALQLEITCEALDRQLSAVAQVSNSCLSSLSTLESLEITVAHKNWQGKIEVIQWREFLHPLTSVMNVTLEFEDSIRLVAPALQELAGGGATEVLPALQNLFLRTYGWQPSGPVKEAIERFIATRRLCGRPVTVHY